MQGLKLAAVEAVEAGLAAATIPAPLELRAALSALPKKSRVEVSSHPKSRYGSWRACSATLSYRVFRWRDRVKRSPVTRVSSRSSRWTPSPAVPWTTKAAPSHLASGANQHPKFTVCSSRTRSQAIVYRVFRWLQQANTELFKRLPSRYTSPAATECRAQLQRGGYGGGRYTSTRANGASELLAAYPRRDQLKFLLQASRQLAVRCSREEAD